jgi:hypothetical protein
MAREFIMGARIALQDSFSGPLRFIRDSLARATEGTNHYRDVNGRLRNEMGRFVEQAKQAERETRSLAAAAETAHSKMIGLKEAIMAIAAGEAAKKAFDWLVGGNAEMEQYQQTLNVVMRDQQKAAETLQWATKFAAQTPFEIPGVVEATVRLQSYGIEAQRTLGTIGDMAAVMGKPLMQAVEAVADAQTGELERLKEFGITKQMLIDQAAKMGAHPVNNQGQITDQVAFNAALFSLMEQRFKGGMDLQSKTFKGMLSNASDFIGTMGRQLGAPLFDKVKAGLQDTLAWAQRLKDSGQLDAWVQRVQRGAAVAWQVMTTAGGAIKEVFTSSFNVARQNVEMIAGKMRAWYAEHQPQLQRIGQLFVEAFQALQTAWAAYAVPTIDWLRNTGLPGVVDGLAKVGGWIVDVASWFIDNWGVIGPILAGLAVAWGAYGIKVLAVAGYQKAAALATKGWAAAQAALNFVMNMNPLGLIITGVGLLIGAVILLVRHWDQVSAWLSGIWQAMKDAAVSIFTGIVDWFKQWGGLILGVITGPVGMLVYLVVTYWDQIKAGAVAFWTGIVDGLTAAWTGIKSAFTTGVNFIVGLLNGLIDKMNAALSVKLPDWMGGKEFKMDIPHIPEIDGSHATGLRNVPFDGYRAELHRGERVLTAAENRRYDSALGFQQPAAQPAQPRQVHIEKLVEKVEIIAAPGDDGEALYAKFIDVFYRKARDAASILSSAEMGALL